MKSVFWRKEIEMRRKMEGIKKEEDGREKESKSYSEEEGRKMRKQRWKKREKCGGKRWKEHRMEREKSE